MTINTMLERATVLQCLLNCLSKKPSLITKKFMTCHVPDVVRTPPNLASSRLASAAVTKTVRGRHDLGVVFGLSTVDYFFFGN